MAIVASENPKSQATDTGPQESELSRDLELVLRLIETIQSGSVRKQSIERLVRLIAQMLPGHDVVTAIGTDQKCQMIIDSQVGVIELETPLGREIRDEWQQYSSGTCDNYWRLPLTSGDSRIAWLMIQNDPPLSNRLVHVLERSKDVLGEVLWLVPANNFGIAAIWRDRDNRQRLLLSVIVVFGLLFFPARYRVSCNAKLEPLEQRLVAAPFDVQLDQSLVRPGDHVTKGQELAILDGRPLRIEREALRADLGQARKEHDVALASDKVADAQLAALECERIDNQLKLIDNRLDQLTVQCPLEGIVVSGDMRKAQGMTFGMGDPMFEIAPLEQMMFEIEIPEIDISYVGEESDVRVRLSALGTTVSGKIDQIYPKSEIRDDQNVFVGIWTVENSATQFRPGMEGTATIYGPYRPFAWNWIRRIYEGSLKAVGW